MKLRVNPILRTLGLALALCGFAPASTLASRPEPSERRQAELRTRLGDPATWSSFEECLEDLEHWVGRELPDWVVHSTLFRYPARRPLYDPLGNPLLDAAGRQRCGTLAATGRVFFPPAWRLRNKPRLPLVVYAHATMMEKVDVPSEFGGHEWALAAAAAAYYGIAVAMPDQPGMGGDAGTYHTFCHAKSLAYAIVDALPAVRALPDSDPYLAQRQYGWDGNLYVMGYSEGGYAALATVRELETHPEVCPAPFQLRGSACMAGPFDLSGTTRDEIIDPVQTFAHCFYIPYVILAYHGIYGDLVDPMQAFAPALLRQDQDGNLLEWSDGCRSGLTVDGLIGARLGVPGDAVVLRQLLNPDWLARELDDPAYATSTIRKLLVENDLCGGFRPLRPILFCQSVADREVPLGNTVKAMAALGAEIRKAGGDPDRLLAFLPLGKDSDRITHIEGAMLAIPAAFNWIYCGMPVR